MRLQRFRTLFAFALVFFCYFFPLSCQKKTVIAIQPLGKVNREIMSIIQAGVENFYGFQVDVLPEKEMPAWAYYEPRDRYDASALLRKFKKEYPKRFDKILILTENDIYRKKEEANYRGIVGLGLVGGRACIVSLHRLKMAGGEKPALFQERAVKSSVHEVGHTLGLHHCKTSDYCIMKSAAGKVTNIDKKELQFCPNCQELILENLATLAKGN